MPVRERVGTAARRGGAFCKRRGKWFWRGFKKRFVYVITKDKTIQAVMTAAVFAIFDKSLTAVAQGVSLLLLDGPGVAVSTNILVALLMVLVFGAAMWADYHTEAFREWVEEKTGEEAAENGKTEAADVLEDAE